MNVCVLLMEMQVRPSPPTDAELLRFFDRLCTGTKQKQSDEIASFAFKKSP